MEFKRWPQSLGIALAALALCAAPAWVGAQEPAPVEPAQKLIQVKQDFETRQAELRKGFREVEDEEERNALYEEFKQLVKQAVRDAREVAESVPGTETAAEGWSFVLRYGPQAGNQEMTRKALDHLIEKHIASPVWKELSSMVGDLGQMGLGDEKTEKALRTLIEKSPLKSVQAAAMFGLGTFLAEQKSEGKRAEGLAFLRRLGKDFADDKEAKEYVERAEGTIFQLEKLQVGMPCPDFEASDENGAKFKLSDYKGKVVLIDFWGYW